MLNCLCLHLMATLTTPQTRVINFGGEWSTPRAMREPPHGGGGRATWGGSMDRYRCLWWWSSTCQLRNLCRRSCALYSYRVNKMFHWCLHRRLCISWCSSCRGFSACRPHLKHGNARCGPFMEPALLPVLEVGYPLAAGAVSFVEAIWPEAPGFGGVLSCSATGYALVGIPNIFASQSLHSTITDFTSIVSWAKAIKGVYWQVLFTFGVYSQLVACSIYSQFERSTTRRMGYSLTTRTAVGSQQWYIGGSVVELVVQVQLSPWCIPAEVWPLAISSSQYSLYGSLDSSLCREGGIRGGDAKGRCGVCTGSCIGISPISFSVSSVVLRYMRST